MVPSAVSSQIDRLLLNVLKLKEFSVIDASKTFPKRKNGVAATTTTTTTTTTRGQSPGDQSIKRGAEQNTSLA
jgi:hypothetical protein